MAAAKGEHLCIVGGSGSGKTTLLNVIAGITLPDEGKVVVKGTDITALARARAGPLPRAPRRLRLPGLQPAAGLLGARERAPSASLRGSRAAATRRTARRSLLERVGLGAKRANKPAALSVGEQQRVALARAVACRPSLLLADEPTANLDPANAATRSRSCSEVAAESGAALLVVTHDERIRDQFPRVEVTGVRRMTLFLMVRAQPRAAAARDRATAFSVALGVMLTSAIVCARAPVQGELPQPGQRVSARRRREGLGAAARPERRLPPGQESREHPVQGLPRARRSTRR